MNEELFIKDKAQFLYFIFIVKLMEFVINLLIVLFDDIIKAYS